MSRTFGENCAQTSNTVGTGPYDLDDTPKGSYLPLAANYADGDAPAYWVRNRTNTKWEKNRRSEDGTTRFTPGTPDRLSRNVVRSTNDNAPVDWTTEDLPLTIVIQASDADLAEGVITGWLAAVRDSLLRAGAWFWKAGATPTDPWVYKLVVGDGEDDEIRCGQYDPVKNLVFEDGRRPSTAVGAANKTFGANDIGGLFSFNNTAAPRTGTLPKGSDVGDGYWFEVLGLSTANGIVLTPDAGDGIDGGADGASKTVSGRLLVRVRWSAADDQWITATPSEFRTGAVQGTYNSTADAGWLMMDDGTIGDSSSTADHKGAIYQNLFTVLWAISFASGNTICVVSGGALGVNAAADWAAHKKMDLPKMLGRVVGVAGTGTGLSARALGDTVGSQTHNHGGSTSTTTGPLTAQAGAQTGLTQDNHVHSISLDSSMQPTGFMNMQIKL